MKTKLQAQGAKLQDANLEVHGNVKFAFFSGGLTHWPHSSSFLELPYRILHMNPKKELLWGLWVVSTGAA